MSGHPSDFNDLHHLRGLKEVRRQLFAALNALHARSVDSGNGAMPEHDPPEDVPPLTAYEEVPASSGADDEYWPADHDWYWQLDRTSSGRIQPHAANLDLILANDARWAGVLGYCQFSYRIRFLRQPPIEVGPDGQGDLEDNDIARLRIWLHRHYEGLPPPPRNELSDALIAVSQRHRFHPVRDYLKSLRHDGDLRLAGWLKRAFNAGGPPEYLAAVGTKFLVGAVARVMRPGCKMDDMLILEGEQGTGKSTALAVLFGDWFSDAPIPLGDKDAYLLLQGVWGYEMSELDSLNKTESTTAKAFLSQRTDRFRPPYGTSLQSFPRQTVALGTTNQNEYLKDYSGNRRYWPVMCASVDLDWLREQRDQLWAEAFKLYQDGVAWWVATDAERALFEEEQEARLSRDAWEDPIREWLANSTTRYFTYADVLTGALGLDVGYIQRVHQNRLAPIMKHLGWKKERKSIKDPRGSGKTTKSHVYVRPESGSGGPEDVQW